MTRCFSMTLLATSALFLTNLPAAAPADDYRVEKLAEAAPVDGLSDEVRNRLAAEGLRIIKGKSRTFIDFWPATKWTAKPDFTPSLSILYPFEFGELVGVLRYKSKATDFRGQEIPAGVYTVRYALQPEDGNHVGTSDTRDFLLLLPIESDTAAAPIGEEQLFKLSSEVVGTTHPAMLALLRANSTAETIPVIEHNEERELFSLLFKGTAETGGKTAEIPVQFVVVGQAEE